MKYLLIIFLSLPFYCQLNAQKLSENEEKIISYINQQMPQTLNRLEELVNINSGTMNTAGVKKVGSILQQEFEKIKFETNWINLPDSLKRAGHLYAHRKGKKGKKILLLGHLDTVFELDQPFKPYSVLNDSSATGQGVVDMKSGDIIILTALQTLNNLGFLNDAQIGVYLTGDEEKGGNPAEITRADLIEKSKSYDVALGFESGKLKSVVTGRRGSSTWKLKVQGKQGHSSGIFGKKAGYGAIYEAARILDSFRIVLSNKKNLTVSPGLIAGGTELVKNEENVEVSGKDNVIASNAIVSGDLRFLTEKQKESARKKMSKIVYNNNLPECTAEISFSDGIPSMEPKEGNKALLEILNAVSLDMGLSEVKAGNPAKRGAGDISFVAKNLDCLDGLGASGKGSHTPNEIMNLKEYPQLIQRTAILIYRLIQEENEEQNN